MEIDEGEQEVFEKEEREELSDYWAIDHHHFDYNQYAHLLLQLDPLSYHQMGLAVPGTFVEQGTWNVEMSCNKYSFYLQ